jgi:hypothetical protein
MYESVVKPAVESGSVSFLGELQADTRDPILAGAFATLMLGSWPEPFGLVAIESMATGTPVIGRRAGALPEIIEPGVDGFLVDDLREAEVALRRVPDLDRARIRQRALERFSVARMTRDYESVYAAVLDVQAKRRAGGSPVGPQRLSANLRVDGMDLSDGQRSGGQAPRLIRRSRRPLTDSRRSTTPTLRDPA